jgi:hypothetical protein
MKSTLLFIALACLVIWKYKALLGMGVALVGSGGTMFHLLAGFLFAYGFWELGILGLILWGIITALVENEHGIWAVVTMIAALFSYNALAKAHLLDLVKDHPWKTAAYLLSYFVLGFFWSFFKWGLFLKSRLNNYNDFKAEYLRSHGKTELTPEVIEDFKTRLGQWASSKKIEITPKVDDHMGDLVRWASFWPWSVFWFVINNPIRRLYESAFRLFHGALQGLSDRMFAHVEKELSIAPPESDWQIGTKEPGGIKWTNDFVKAATQEKAEDLAEDKGYHRVVVKMVMKSK